MTAATQLKLCWRNVYIFKNYSNKEKNKTMGSTSKRHKFKGRVIDIKLDRLEKGLFSMQNEI